MKHINNNWRARCRLNDDFSRHEACLKFLGEIDYGQPINSSPCHASSSTITQRFEWRAINWLNWRSCGNCLNTACYRDAYYYYSSRRACRGHKPNLSLDRHGCDGILSNISYCLWYLVYSEKLISICQIKRQSKPYMHIHIMAIYTYPANTIRRRALLQGFRQKSRRH